MVVISRNLRQRLDGKRSWYFSLLRGELVFRRRGFHRTRIVFLQLLTLVLEHLRRYVLLLLGVTMGAEAVVAARAILLTHQGWQGHDLIDSVALCLLLQKRLGTVIQLMRRVHFSMLQAARGEESGRLFVFELRWKHRVRLLRVCYDVAELQELAPRRRGLQRSVRCSLVLLQLLMLMLELD